MISSVSMALISSRKPSIADSATHKLINIYIYINQKKKNRLRALSASVVLFFRLAIISGSYDNSFRDMKTGDVKKCLRVVVVVV